MNDDPRRTLKRGRALSRAKQPGLHPATPPPMETARQRPPPKVERAPSRGQLQTIRFRSPPTRAGN